MKKVLMIVAAASVIGGAATTASAAALAKCKACHSFEAGEHKTGPSLAGIMGSTMGGTDFGNYGSYLKSQKAAGATWNEDNMKEWLADSKGMAKAAGEKTSMPKQNLKDAKLDAAIAELKAL
ncbi:MAG: cytochrome C [Mariprofundaceae bacterium]|nr:cytochrome C [Mariprofundaceae bacterium]